MVDAVLVSQGFRDLVDDARGVLLDLLMHLSGTAKRGGKVARRLDITHPMPTPLEIAPADGRHLSRRRRCVPSPGCGSFSRDPHAQPGSPLPHATQDRVAAITAEFVKRLQLA